MSLVNLQTAPPTRGQNIQIPELIKAILVQTSTGINLKINKFIKLINSKNL